MGAVMRAWGGTCESPCLRQPLALSTGRSAWRWSFVAIAGVGIRSMPSRGPTALGAHFLLQRWRSGRGLD